MTSDGRAAADFLLAAALFAVDPPGLGGVALRGAAGPGRERWLACLGALLPADAPVGRLPSNIDDSRLLGGLDLPSSLAAGRPVVERGVLASCDGGIATLSMAERIDGELAARIAAVLDAGEVVIERDGIAVRLPARVGLVALDEGLAPEERPPDALLDRLAIQLDLETARPGGDDAPRIGREAVAAARGRLADIAPASEEVVAALCAVATELGIASLRAPVLALRLARVHAALQGRSAIAEEDAAVAARLVLAPRALVVAETPPAETPTPCDPAEPQEDAAGDAEGAPSARSSERTVEAVRTALPEGLLERAQPGAAGRVARSARGRGAGAATSSARRGRPAGSRPGALRPGDRLDLPATLRAAAPWRLLRAGGRDVCIQVRPDDFRIRRFIRRRESTAIFVVDASGSAAAQRLAEAKGAVELLLARAYVSRARVALVAFRNATAEILLEPTRSLTRARRRLADLPGGGGTPLAAGLDAALALALAETARDRTPLIVVLTDGRANVGLDGAAGRDAAEADALGAARRIAQAGVGCVFIDTSIRGRPDGDRFARAMGARYAMLPYVKADAVLGLVDDLRAARR